MSLKLGSNDTAILAGSSVVKQMLLGSSPKFAAPVLDHVPGAAAAYSLRRLSNAYTGPVVKVRRSSDSTTADFTAAEVVDGTLTAWVGAGDGFVHTWYDQSGNARNATQTTAGYQPKIVSSGVLVTEGGKPALSFDGVDDTLAVASSTSTFNFLHNGTRSAVFSVARFGDSANQDDIYAVLGNNNGGTANVGAMVAFEDRSSGSANNRLHVFVARGVGGTAAVAYTTNNTLTPYEPHVAAVLFDVSNPTVTLRAVPYVDGATVNGGNSSALAPSAANATYDLHLGSSAAGGAFLLGTISELIIYPSDVSASRELAEGEMAWHYGLQSKLPYNHAYAPQALGGASQTVPTDSDAIAYLAAVAAADGAPVERSVAIAIDDFVKGLKADGLWSAIGSACVLAGARTVAGALVPLKGAAPTGYNWVASDYSRSLGLKGDGSTKYIDSNRANNADPQNDKHLAVYATSIASSGKGGYIGGYTSSPVRTSQILRPGVAATVVSSLNDATGSTVALTSAGFIGASRLSTAFSLRADGVTTGSTSSTVSGLTSNALVFARNGDGSPVSYSDARLSFYSAGSSLDLALLDARVSALMSALGAAL